ncbi:MAG: tetratricopeptide repeat protein [Rhodocyclaceae bacterium]|nr:tetratricopeptide repeat protein [Rhodocyclaceae bacterium]
MREGEQLYSEKKYDEALDKFGQVILKRSPILAGLLVGGSHVHRERQLDGCHRQRQESIRPFPQGAGRDPGVCRGALWRRFDALKNGRFAESIGHFVEFLKLEPGNARAWLNVGKAYLEQQQFREGLGALVQGLARRQQRGTVGTRRRVAPRRTAGLFKRQVPRVHRFAEGVPQYDAKTCRLTLASPKPIGNPAIAAMRSRPSARRCRSTRARRKPLRYLFRR